MTINQIKAVRKQQSGVGLVEVMIAVLVLSFGFLAAAKMQIAGMRYSQNAYFLSQGTFMLRDMTDRMRANRTGVLAGNYDAYTTTASTTNPGCFTNGTECTPAEIASADLHAWSAYLHAPTGAVNFKPLLPSIGTAVAKGQIALSATTGVYTVSVTWAELSDGEVEEQVLSVLLTP